MLKLLPLNDIEKNKDSQIRVNSQKEAFKYNISTKYRGLAVNAYDADPIRKGGGAGRVPLAKFLCV